MKCNVAISIQENFLCSVVAKKILFLFQLYKDYDIFSVADLKRLSVFVVCLLKRGVNCN